jgi:hypothetical protein
VCSSFVVIPGEKIELTAGEPAQLWAISPGPGVLSAILGYWKKLKTADPAMEQLDQSGEKLPAMTP